MEIITRIEYPGYQSTAGFIDQPELHGLKADLIVVDENTSVFLSPPQREISLVLPSGEEAKTLDSIENIISAAVKRRLDRSSLILGVGGGVICDMTALAASLYMRGTRVELVPTTLLAMVDASVGGKTGVDFGHYKNMIGTFYPAEKVHMPAFALDKLPQKEYLCGLAEVIKTAILGDKELFIQLEKQKEAYLSRDSLLVRDMILRCVRVKGRIVQEDLKENGLRACLNLGHTFGHALESVTGFSKISHGEAVAWGMVMAARAAQVRGDLEKPLFERIIRLIGSYGYRLDYDFSFEALMEAMGHDKKSRSGQVRFILPAGLEKYVITPLENDLLKHILTGD